MSETTKNTDADELRDMVRQINAFDRQCKATEYTDTGEAWQLLHHLRRVMREMLKKEHP